MKLTVLTDDNIYNHKGLLAEHGLCFYIETDGKKILFDTGYSDIFIKNAKKLGLNLLDLDYIVLSHGHYDHTWGLTHYLEYYTNALNKKIKAKKTTIITHPNTFFKRFEEGAIEVGCPISKEELSKHFNVKTTKEPFKLTKKLFFLGEIPRENDFEAIKPMEKLFINGEYQDDYVTEDSALAYKSDEHLSIMTGCSHSGICNIIEYAKKISKLEYINHIIGGFHLINSSNKKMDKILEYFSTQNINELNACHCTGLKARIKLASKLNLKETGVGTELIF